jgi:DnaJ-class molecular chaperone
VEVPIEVGFPNQEKIIIPGKGNENPDYETGDLVVIVTTEKSKEYERKGNDLYMTKKISLIESLCGFSFNHKHISDNEITIQTPPNKIIKH